jgi:hypothetical protein
VAAVALTTACGKEGPPLPPLIRLPAAPADIRAERRGDSVKINFAVPSANTDGTRPANVARVEVYAITAPATITEDQFLKLSERVASVDAKAPRDPNDTVDPDEPVSDAAAPEGAGLDQGAAAVVTEKLSSDEFRVVDLPNTKAPVQETPASGAPLSGPPLAPPARLYAAAGVSTSGRRGPLSPRIGAPLVPPPPAVPDLDVAYDETVITLTWPSAAMLRPIQEPASEGVLPATLAGWLPPTAGFNVYETKEGSETRLNESAQTAARFEDKRLEWGVERCYTVHVTHIYERLQVEGAGSPVVCVTPSDTFPPKPPTNLRVVPSEGAISLIWQRGEERDLAGFIVLRAALPSDELTPVTPSPIQETSFVDKVAPGVRYVYAVQAVDNAGNRSEPSTRSDEVEAR